jgi:hypothetical protein
MSCDAGDEDTVRALAEREQIIAFFQIHISV